MIGLFHIPHSSRDIPDEYLKHFHVSREDLGDELLKMTDHFTDELFDFPDLGWQAIRFPVSRLLVDPERFPADEDEVMSKVGMGCIYVQTHDGRALKNATTIRKELLQRYYEPHHKTFSEIVDQQLEDHSKVLIIDCHSFPRYPLPYELDQEVERSEVCIGTDEFHTPKKFKNALVDSFEKQGFSVSVNRPFSGSIVPMKFYQHDKRVMTVMIEIRRDLYMDETSGEKIVGFDAVKSKIGNVISNLARYDKA